jgi:hypothetical protein
MALAISIIGTDILNIFATISTSIKRVESVYSLYTFHDISWEYNYLATTTEFEHDCVEKVTSTEK